MLLVVEWPCTRSIWSLSLPCVWTELLRCRGSIQWCKRSLGVWGWNLASRSISISSIYSFVTIRYSNIIITITLKNKMIEKIIHPIKNAFWGYDPKEAIKKVETTFIRMYPKNIFLIIIVYTKNLFIRTTKSCAWVMSINIDLFVAVVSTLLLSRSIIGVWNAGPGDGLKLLSLSKVFRRSVSVFNGCLCISSSFDNIFGTIFL